jgi:hypothetical protein
MLPCARACGSPSGPVLRAAFVALVGVWIAWMPAAHASPQRLEGWLAQVYATPEPIWFTPAGPRPSVMAAHEIDGRPHRAIAVGSPRRPRGHCRSIFAASITRRHLSMSLRRS